MKLSAEQIQEFEQWQARQEPQPGDDKLSWWDRSYRDMQIWLKLRTKQATAEQAQVRQEAIIKEQEKNKDLFALHDAVMRNFRLTHPDDGERTKTPLDLINEEMSKYRK